MPDDLKGLKIAEAPPKKFSETAEVNLKYGFQKIEQRKTAEVTPNYLIFDTKYSALGSVIYTRNPPLESLFYFAGPRLNIYFSSSSRSSNNF